MYVCVCVLVIILHVCFMGLVIILSPPQKKKLGRGQVLEMFPHVHDSLLI